MQGRRLYTTENDYPFYFEKEMQPGDYANFWGKFWLMKAPNGDVGVCHKGPWQIAEHDDGTITVTPSLQFRADGWHGWLTAGKWRAA